MNWDAITYDVYDSPCLRRMDETLPFGDFEDQNEYEHDNGKIWAATLWDIFVAFGRSVSGPLTIESHFQLDGFTMFARGVRAILDADRNLNSGRNASGLKGDFGARQIGPV